MPEPLVDQSKDSIPPIPPLARVILAAFGLLFLGLAGLFFAYGVSGGGADPGREKVAFFIFAVLAGALLVLAVACFFLALKRDPSASTTGSVASEGDEEPRSEGAATPALASEEVTQGTQRSGKRERSDAEMIQADIDRVLEGGLVGAVLGIVAGAAGGARLFGVIGAIIGAILGAPVGMLLGAFLAWLVPEFLAGVVLFVFLLISMLRETRIGSFVASPNPVSTGNSLTLTASNIRVGNLRATVERVAFLVEIDGTKKLLGYGTQTSEDTWTLNLTVSLPPGSYTLLARARDSGGASSRPVPLTLIVQ
jgi:hypothetical protein